MVSDQRAKIVLELANELRRQFKKIGHANMRLLDEAFLLP
jgi:hypothetical protein